MSHEDSRRTELLCFPCHLPRHLGHVNSDKNWPTTATTGLASGRVPSHGAAAATHVGMTLKGTLLSFYTCGLCHTRPYSLGAFDAFDAFSGSARSVRAVGLFGNHDRDAFAAGDMRDILDMVVTWLDYFVEFYNTAFLFH